MHVLHYKARETSLSINPCNPIGPGSAVDADRALARLEYSIREYVAKDAQRGPSQASVENTLSSGVRCPSVVVARPAYRPLLSTTRSYAKGLVFITVGDWYPGVVGSGAWRPYRWRRPLRGGGDGNAVDGGGPVVAPLGVSSGAAPSDLAAPQRPLLGARDLVRHRDALGQRSAAASSRQRPTRVREKQRRRTTGRQCGGHLWQTRAVAAAGSSSFSRTDHSRLGRGGRADDDDKSACLPPILLGGQTLKRVAKRLKPLRGVGGGLIGGKALLALDGDTDLALAMEATSDGDRSEHLLVFGRLERLRRRVRATAVRRRPRFRQPRAGRAMQRRRRSLLHATAGQLPRHHRSRPAVTRHDQAGRTRLDRWGVWGGSRGPRRLPGR